jgi:cytochrome b561
MLGVTGDVCTLIINAISQSHEEAIMDRSAGARYASSQIALHWVMLLLIAAAYACIELRVLYPKGSDVREALKNWHYMLGVLIFGLAWLRLLARLFWGAPPIVPRPARWQLYPAHAVQFLIYVFLISMPLLGWLILSGEGESVPFFGAQLPPLIGANKELAKQLEEIHVLVGNIGYFLIGIHAAAAIAHHYINRDNTLVRMLPGRGPGAQRAGIK